MSDEPFVARIDTRVRVPLLQIIDHDRKWLEGAISFRVSPMHEIDPRSFSYEPVSLDSDGCVTFRVKASRLVGLDESTPDAIKETLFAGPHIPPRPRTVIEQLRDDFDKFAARMTTCDSITGD